MPSSTPATTIAGDRAFPFFRDGEADAAQADAQGQCRDRVRDNGAERDPLWPVPSASFTD
jgi:hypothetical protein